MRFCSVSLVKENADYFNLFMLLIHSEDDDDNDEQLLDGGV